MRLIDADAFKENMKRKYRYYGQSQDDIDAQPTIDAVQVVRCKDCIHWIEYDKEMMCAAVCSDPYEAWASEANDYCSLGERKEGEKNENCV